MLTSSDLQSDVPTSATTMLHANATTNMHVQRSAATVPSSIP
jgi:hypothetical protein